MKNRKAVRYFILVFLTFGIIPFASMLKQKRKKEKKNFIFPGDIIKNGTLIVL